MKEGRLGITVSRRGYRESAENGDRLVVLLDGRRYEGVPGNLDFNIMNFERYAMKVESRETQAEGTSTKAMSTFGLIQAPSNAHLAELLWRIGLPIAAFVLALLAIPLSFVNPRASRSVNLIFALFTYMVYANVLSIVQAWVSQGRVGFNIGWWVVHAGMLGVLGILFYRRIRVGSLARQKALKWTPCGHILRGRSTGRPLFVFAAFLALFAFFDLINELTDLGKGGYRAAARHRLCGAHRPEPRLRALSAGGSDRDALCALASRGQLRVHGDAQLRPHARGARSPPCFRIGVVFAVATLIFGELIAPVSERAAKQLKLSTTSTIVASEFHTGLWVKDDRRFVNVREVQPDTTLADIRVFEFDDQYRLKSISFAKHGQYLGKNMWRLREIVNTVFTSEREQRSAPCGDGMGLGSHAGHSGGVVHRARPHVSVEPVPIFPSSDREQAEIRAV